MNSLNGRANKMEAEDLLAVNLTQLEMGYPLDELGADLPEQEARLLHLAASLQKTAFPVEDDTAVISQRAQLLRAAESCTHGPIP
jgi:hypothetical protein